MILLTVFPFIAGKKEKSDMMVLKDILTLGSADLTPTYFFFPTGAGHFLDPKVQPKYFRQQCQI